MRGALAVGLVSALAACTTPSPPVTPTWTAAPVVIATTLPTASPSPVPSAATPADPPTPPPAQQVIAYVGNTGGQGLILRRTPGGEAVAVIPDGSPLSLPGDEQQAAGRRWRKARDGAGREGWVASEFLVAEPPPPSPGPPSATSGAAPTPSPGEPMAAPAWPVPLIPTATRGANAAPTRTRPPAASPAPPRASPPIATPEAQPAVRPALPPLVSPSPAALADGAGSDA